MASTFDDIKNAGFKGVRLPVTYAYHYKTQSPDWTLDPVWLERVSTVLDMITSRGLYVITNVHHDSWTWADYTQGGANITAIEERLYKTWVQIGQKLACKGEKVVSLETRNLSIGLLTCSGFRDYQRDPWHHRSTREGGQQTEQYHAPGHQPSGWLQC